jgi:hypothetical protein
MGQLRDREHEDEVEEQLDIGHAMMVVTVANTQVVVARGLHDAQTATARTIISRGPPKSIIDRSAGQGGVQ